MSSKIILQLDEYYDLPKTGSFKIGRSALCNVILNDTHVSKVHCSLVCRKDDPCSSAGSKVQVMISDHSSNGTWISTSGKTIKLEKEKPTLLKQGDVIFLTRFTVENHEIIAYKYHSVPFPRLAKCIYKITEDNANMLQSEERNGQISDEKTGKLVLNVCERESASKSMDANISGICANAPVGRRNGSPDSVSINYKESDVDKEKCKGKSICKAVKNQKGNFESNDSEGVENACIDIKPSALDSSVYRHQSPSNCMGEQSEKRPDMKRKYKADEQYAPARKVRFKDQIEENLDRLGWPTIRIPDKYYERCTENLDIHVGAATDHASFGAAGKESCTSSTKESHTFVNTSTLDNCLQRTSDKVEGLTHLDTSEVMKESENLPSSSGSPSEFTESVKGNEKMCNTPATRNTATREKFDQSSGLDTCMPSMDDTDNRYGKCVHCGKLIPCVTISLHEAVCEGLSQEVKSQDHVPLSSRPLETCLFQSESKSEDQSSEKMTTSFDENDISGAREHIQDEIEDKDTVGRDSERALDETCAEKGLATSRNLRDISQGVLEKCTGSAKIIGTSTVTSCESVKPEEIGMMKVREMKQNEMCEQETLEITTTLTSTTQGVEGSCTRSEIINTSTIASKSDKLEEQLMAKTPALTERREQEESLSNRDTECVSPRRNPPTLEKEESKERCTFCSALFPLPELILHVSICSKISAIPCTNPSDTESQHEGCPYCGNLLDVIDLVEHAEHCKSKLSTMINTREMGKANLHLSPLVEKSFVCSSQGGEDASMTDRELCPKCNQEFALLELLSHADECTGERPSTSSGLEPSRGDGSGLLDSSHAGRGSDKVVHNKSEDKTGSSGAGVKCDRSDRGESKRKDLVPLSDKAGIDKSRGSFDSGIHRKYNEDDSDYNGEGDAADESVSNDDKIKEDFENNISSSTSREDDKSEDDVDKESDNDDVTHKEGADDDNVVTSGAHGNSHSDNGSSMYSDDELSAPKGHTNDDDREHVVAMETSEDDAESDEFEFCPNCRKLFHLSRLIEHASTCTTGLSASETTLDSTKTCSGTNNSSEASTLTPGVFSDCAHCGVRLPVDVMAVHYPRCATLYAAKRKRDSGEGCSRSEESDPAHTPGPFDRIDNLSSRLTLKGERKEKRPASASKTSTLSGFTTVSKTEVGSLTGDSRNAEKITKVVLKRSSSSLESYQDCEEQCMYCLKMFAVGVLVEHASACATDKAAGEDLEQCCYCSQIFPLNDLINHAQNCDQRTASSSQEDASANSQSSSGELLERCMYCFKDFPVSKLIRHSQKCDGDMSGPRERFQGFLPSVHDLSAISSLAILNDKQEAALQYVIARSAQDSKKVSSGLLARVQGLGYSEHDLNRTLQWVRSAAPIIIHINLDKVLNFLVEDSHYRNQFETGTSGGSTDLAARRSWEDRIFNNSYKHSSPSERVKYGVLNIVGDPRGVRSCINYGDSFLQLKKVRLRTTFASMDTSGIGVKLSCCEHYENVLYAYTDKEITAIMDVATGKVPFHQSDCISHYKEVQIHGPVSLSENVECIVVNARHRGNPRITSLLYRFVEQNECNLIWMDPDDLAGAAPLPFGASRRPLPAELVSALSRRGPVSRGPTKSSRTKR